MTKSVNGCFSGIARVLLCKGSHQTHPSDIDKKVELDHSQGKDQSEFSNEGDATSVAYVPPNVVARLMGLEPLPRSRTDTGQVAPRRLRAPDAVRRSKSVNFVDYLLDFDASSVAVHRRFRSSVSFREVPPLVYGRNRDFLVLYLDDKEERQAKKNSAFTMRRREVGCQKFKQKNETEQIGQANNDNVINKNGKNRTRSNLKLSAVKSESRRVYNCYEQASRSGSCSRVCISHCKKKDSSRQLIGESETDWKVKNLAKPNNQNELLDESKVVKKTKKTKNMKPKRRSFEDKSPVSVLDVGKFPIQESMMMQVKLKSTMNKYTTKNCSDSSEDQVQQVKVLYKLTEEDIDGTCWKENYNVVEHECVESICKNVGQQIFDLILYQLVAEEILEGKMNES